MSANGGTLSAQQRVERDRRIAEARAAGATWAEVAAGEGVSVATAKRAVQAHGLAVVGLTSLDDVDGDALLLRVIRSHISMLATAERLAVGGDNSSARVGGVRGALAVGRSLLEVLSAFDLIRGHRGLENFHAELRKVGEVVALLADEHDLPEEDVQAAFDEIESVAARRAGVVDVEVVAA